MPAAVPVSARGRPRSHAGEPTAEQVRAAVATFALLSDPTRVRLLWALQERDLDVGSLAAAVGATANATSQHLARLRLSGLVQARRDGRRAVYALRGAHVRALLREALSQADHQVSGAPVHD